MNLLPYTKLCMQIYIRYDMIYEMYDMIYNISIHTVQLMKKN